METYLQSLSTYERETRARKMMHKIERVKEAKRQIPKRDKS